MTETEQRRSSDPTEHRHTMKRRGLIAGAAALAAGLMAKQAAQPVLAAAAMAYANTTATVTNGPVQGQTNLSGAVPSGQTMFNVDASATVGSATAIVGRGAGTLSGLFGYGGTNLGAGVVGVEGGGASPGEVWAPGSMAPATATSACMRRATVATEYTQSAPVGKV